jgi:hypothetical protein
MTNLIVAFRNSTNVPQRVGKKLNVFLIFPAGSRVNTETANSSSASVYLDTEALQKCYQMSASYGA